MEIEDRRLGSCSVVQSVANPRPIKDFPSNGPRTMTNFLESRIAMVDCQIRPSDVTRYNVIDAMLSVPREAFVPQIYRDVAYADKHVPLGEGRVVLEPRVCGKMLDALALTNRDLVLDIGCGLGYMAALAGQMAEAVVAVEEIEDLAEQASQALVAGESDNVVVETGSLVEGSPEHGPYDAMIIEGAVHTVPDTILDQLKEDGRIAAIFMDGQVGQCKIGKKAAGQVTWRRVFDATAPVLVDFAQEKAFEF